MKGCFGKFAKDMVRQSAGFRSEDQKKTLGTFHGPERFLPFFREYGHLIFLRRHVGQKIREIIPDSQFDVFPVVKPGSFDFPAVKRKTQGPDKMQDSPGGQAGTTDIACIPVDFRRHKDNVALDLSVVPMMRVYAQFSDTEIFDVFRAG